MNGPRLGRLLGQVNVRLGTPVLQEIWVEDFETIVRKGLISEYI